MDFNGDNSAFISSETDKVVNGGEAHNYVMCVLSDTQDDDTNVNARNNTLPKVYFLNDEVTLQLVNPSVSELGSNNTGITAETMKGKKKVWLCNLSIKTFQILHLFRIIRRVVSKLPATRRVQHSRR